MKTTKLKTDSQQQIEEMMLVNLVVENSPVVIFRWKATDGWPVEYVSNNVTQFGYTVQELMSGDTSYSSIIHPDDLERVSLEVANHSVKNVADSFEQEYRIVSPSKEVFWVDDRTTVEKNDAGNIIFYQGILLDITVRKQMEAELVRLSNHDALTGLYNRRVLDERLAKDIQRANRYKHSLSLFMIDIDHFKSVNDSYGHATGDLIIKGVSRIIEGSIREIDYSSRYGGEEFVVVLPETSLTDAEELAERLCSTVEEKSFEIKDGSNLSVTISIGVSGFIEESKSSEHLINQADSALYEAKDFGRNCVKVKRNKHRHPQFKNA